MLPGIREWYEAFYHLLSEVGMGYRIPWSAIRGYSEYLELDSDEAPFFISAIQQANDLIIASRSARKLTVEVLDGQVNGIA